MTIGAVALTTTIVIRLMAMSGWILWTVAGIFENLGTVQEGMETIAKPNAVLDEPEAKPLRGDPRRDPVRGDRLPLRQGGRRHHREPDADDRAGREGRARRPLGRGQVDAGQPAAAVLRPGEGPHPDRRAGHLEGDAGEPARADRDGDAGHVAAASLDPRQHPLRPARRRRGGDAGDGEAGAGGRVHRSARRSARAHRAIRRTSASVA